MLEFNNKDCLFHFLASVLAAKVKSGLTSPILLFLFYQVELITNDKLKCS